jgi:hypothetical protein
MSRIQLRSLVYGCCSAALSLAAGACSGDVVSLGEVSKDLAANPSRCQDSTLVDGSVVIENQARLDQLAGCETIAGNLYVRPFEAPDLRPLASLSEVGGALELGRLSVFDMLDLPLEEQEQIDQVTAREQALLDGGWLGSLEGLESLSRVDSLKLAGVSAPDLEPLSNLSALAGGGTLQIGPCTDLRSLRGLERLAGVVDLILNCDSLETLAGLPSPSRMGDVQLAGVRLADLADFAPESLNELSISGTALENLDALAGLQRASRVAVANNPALVNVDGLDGLGVVGELSITSNPRLARLPELSMSELGAIRIVNNDTLTNFPSLPNLGLFSGSTAWGVLAPDDALRVRPNLIEVLQNPALEHLVIPTGWLAASYVDIAGNERLASIDLSALHAADGLWITANPQLASVALGVLETVDDLRVIDNAVLPLDAFDALQTFQRIVQSGPLDPSQL